MKKKLLALLLLVPILLIPIISCEGDALGGLSELMESFGKNSLIKGKIVVPDTSQGAKATEAMSDLAKLDKTDEGYADAYTAAVEEIRKATEEALASKNSAKAKAFVEEMQKPRAEGAGLPTKVEDAKGKLESETGIELEIETEGDLLAAILLVDLMDAVEAAEDDWEDASEEDILKFVGEASQVIDVVKTVSPVNGVKLDDILDELLGGDLAALFGGSKGVSRDGEGSDPVDPVTEALGMVKPIIDTIIKGIGIDSNNKINSQGLKRMIGSFTIINYSYERIADSLPEPDDEEKVAALIGKVKFTLTDIVNYIFSVVFAKADGIIGYVTDDKADFEDLINTYIEWNDGNQDAFDELEGLLDGDADLFEIVLSESLETLNKLLPFASSKDMIENLLAEMQDGNRE